jgi:hypothetical protein
MFGLSLPKLLLLAIVAAVVWYGLRAYRRWDEKRIAEAERRDLQAGSEPMVKCPVCGAYNPAGVPCSHRS